MKVENMLYIYIAICISMIFFNIVYYFVLRLNDHQLKKKALRFEWMLQSELARIDSGLRASVEHKQYLLRKLKRISFLTAFDRSLESAFAAHPDCAEKYLISVLPVFVHLATHYRTKDDIRRAYFPYILRKYHIPQYDESGAISQALFELLYSKNVYCRENALSAIYSSGNARDVMRALKIIDQNASFHHPKLICDGLLDFSGSKEELAACMWEQFENYTTGMQLNFLNYIRFAGIRTDLQMLSLMNDEQRHPELRFACIRYFELFPNPDALEYIYAFADTQSQEEWEYQSIATSALKSYPGARTVEILMKNLSSPKWHIRRNAAISCKALGLTYDDLTAVFEGNDRYAREMLRYHFDRREAEKEGKNA